MYNSNFKKMTWNTMKGGMQNNDENRTENFSWKQYLDKNEKFYCFKWSEYKNVTFTVYIEYIHIEYILIVNRLFSAVTAKRF
jgi:hypothetical protein